MVESVERWDLREIRDLVNGIFFTIHKAQNLKKIDVDRFGVREAGYWKGIGIVRNREIVIILKEYLTSMEGKDIGKLCRDYMTEGMVVAVETKDPKWIKRVLDTIDAQKKSADPVRFGNWSQLQKIGDVEEGGESEHEHEEEEEQETEQHATDLLPQQIPRRRRTQRSETPQYPPFLYDLNHTPDSPSQLFPEPRFDRLSIHENEPVQGGIYNIPEGEEGQEHEGEDEQGQDEEEDDDVDPPLTDEEQIAADALMEDMVWHSGPIIWDGLKTPERTKIRAALKKHFGIERTIADRHASKAVTEVILNYILFGNKKEIAFAVRAIECFWKRPGNPWERGLTITERPMVTQLINQVIGRKGTWVYDVLREQQINSVVTKSILAAKDNLEEVEKIVREHIRFPKLLSQKSQRGKD
jgi:hypothetical protein